MRRTVLKSKIHRATVTAADLHYEGSLSIDRDLMDAADILPFEQLHVWDVTNGARLVTYAIPGERGSGTIQINGGGAHHVRPGDVVILATFTELRTKDAKKYDPTVVFVDSQNRQKPAADVVPMAGEPESAPVPVEPDHGKRDKKAK